MKWIAWLLVLLNVVVLAYFSLEQSKPAPVEMANAELQPEKIRLLTEQEIVRLPKKTVQSSMGNPAPEYGCYDWGSFSAANLARAREILDSLGVQATEQQLSSQQARRYWVYIPPLASAGAAQGKIDELDRLGVGEKVIVQEPQWRYAISLGVFKDEQLAIKLLQELRNRGVTSATKGVRNQEKDQASFYISNMSADIAVEIDRLQADFPGSELKQVTCQ